MRSLRRFLLPFLAPLIVAAAVFLLPSASGKKGDRRRPAEPAAGRDLDRSGRTRSESRAIAAAFAELEAKKGSPALRVAEDEDASASPERDDLQALYGTYHPYFVRGDLNGDGRPDFAQAFVEKGPGGWFHVAVFFGAPEGGFEPPVWVERAVSLGAGDLSIDRTVLSVVPDLSFEEARRWRWDSIEQRFLDADADTALRGEGDGVAPNEKSHLRI